jgi:hypothetical protein
MNTAAPEASSTTIHRLLARCMCSRPRRQVRAVGRAEALRYRRNGLPSTRRIILRVFH